MKRTTLRVIVNIAIPVVVIAAWVAMVFGSGSSLAATGLRSLKYFTVLSNFLAAIASVVWLCAGRSGSADADGNRGADGSLGKGAADRGRKVELFKYVAAVSVFVTFMTVVVFLGPLYGYRSMFEGPNLPFHLLVPLAAILEIIFLTDHPYTRRDAWLCLLPPLIYGIAYLANILINGVGEWPDSNDWYLFFHWGYGIGALIYVIMFLATWLLATFLQKMQRVVRNASNR